MTTDQTQEIVREAQKRDDDPALLQGTAARVAMFVLALFMAVGPMLYYIPQFTGWRDVVGYCVALGMVACSPLLTLLVPRAEQERYRQALLDSERARQQYQTELAAQRAAKPPGGTP